MTLPIFGSICARALKFFVSQFFLSLVIQCLTLKNVRDLDVEGYASIVQGLWQCR